MKQKFTLETGSPITIMPNNTKLYRMEFNKPIKERYHDVDKNEVKFLGKLWGDVEHDETKIKLPLLITKLNDITLLLGVNWLKQLPITINKILLDEETDQSEAIYTKNKRLIKTNHKKHTPRVKTQIKPGYSPI